jgi:nucleotide-binding universal stress UspA family protein
MLNIGKGLPVRAAAREGTKAMPGITVGVDGSDNAQHALTWAMKEAALRDVPLTVLTVHETIASYWTRQPVNFTGDDELVARARKAAEQAVADVAKDLGLDAQPRVTVTAINGFAAKTLVDASAGADLLVVGTRGGGGFPHLHLGAVSSQVIHHARCPVVVVPHDR